MGEKRASPEGKGRGEVGRLVESREAEDRRLIALVRTRPLLYARSNLPVASYYGHSKTQWNQVAKEMGWTVAEVRRKWSHIRNSYSRHLRNELLGARTGRGRQVSRWYLADELTFLREHMATDTRPTSSNYQSFAPSFLAMDLSESPSPIDPAETRWFTLPSTGAPGTMATINDKTTKQEEMASEDSSSSFRADENSSFFEFFRGIHAEYLELMPRSRRLYKRQCLQLLHQLLDDQDQDNPLSNDEPEQKVCVIAEPCILPNTLEESGD